MREPELLREVIAHQQQQTPSQEEKRIAIALHLGWKWYRWGDHPDADLFLCTPDHDWRGGSFVPSSRKPDEKFRYDGLPDYFADLNACHSALEAMADDDVNFYSRFDVALHARADERELFITMLGAADWAEVLYGLLNATNGK